MSTAPDLTIRRASPEDAAAVRKLTRLAYAKWVPLIGREPTPMTADYDRVVCEDLVDLLLLDGELVAIVWMVAHPDHLLIENLAVAPARQGLGFGRRLLAHAEGLAAHQGLPLVRLYTHQRFVSNIEFYARSGYRIDREEPFWGGVKVHMSKRVDPDAGDIVTARPAPARPRAPRTRRQGCTAGWRAPLVAALAAPARFRLQMVRVRAHPLSPVAKLNRSASRFRGRRSIDWHRPGSAWRSKNEVVVG